MWSKTSSCTIHPSMPLDDDRLSEYCPGNPVASCRIATHSLHRAQSTFSLFCIFYLCTLDHAWKLVWCDRNLRSQCGLQTRWANIDRQQKKHPHTYLSSVKKKIRKRITVSPKVQVMHLPCPYPKKRYLILDERLYDGKTCRVFIFREQMCSIFFFFFVYLKCWLIFAKHKLQ